MRWNYCPECGGPLDTGWECTVCEADLMPFAYRAVVTDREAETIEKQERDAATIFAAITSGGFENFEQAVQAVTAFWVLDEKMSRSGISRALAMLKEHYAERAILAEEPAGYRVEPRIFIANPEFVADVQDHPDRQPLIDLAFFGGLVLVLVVFMVLGIEW